MLALAFGKADGKDEYFHEENDEDLWASLPDRSMPSSSVEQSQMVNYIVDFLQRENNNGGTNSLAESEATKNDDPKQTSIKNNRNDDYDHDHLEFTHLIAIPVDACHELVLELESVQRAILYHCPLLVHACIAPAMMRLPLLYVYAPSKAATSTVTSTLQNIVQRVVQKHVLALKETADEDEMDNHDDVVLEDGIIRPNLTGPNPDGLLPLMIPFQSLEIDRGDVSSNQVLCTVGSAQHRGTRMLQAMVQELQTEIQTQQQHLGWKTMLPRDLTLHDSDEEMKRNEKSTLFRPRIPFMRLPNDWNTIIRNNYHQTTGKQENNATEDDDDDIVYLTSDLGGNGISPIFWGQWMDDTFGGEAVRLREVAIYQRRRQIEGSQQQEKGRLDETVFYLPSKSVRLPEGNADLARLEAQYQQYQEKRMSDAEQLERQQKNAAQDKTESESTASSTVVDQKDPLFVKTKERLEAVYSQKVQQTQAAPPSESSEQEKEEPKDEEIDTEQLKIPSVRPGNPQELDDWTRERIRLAVEGRARIQTEKQLSQIKDKPAISENPVFNMYKNGTLVSEIPKAKPAKPLPPFPSREHVTGFWKVLNSPTGFDVEEGDSSRSDNLVLRVDGTTAGGPILDQETRQKASGGTWKLLEGDTAWDARLQIRLVIPPKKERILVMEGKLDRVTKNSDLPLARNTFGIPALEERVAQSNADTEELLYCTGHVCVVDAVTGANKMEIGKFSLMKLNTPTDRSQYTITIPKPIRNQD